MGFDWETRQEDEDVWDGEEEVEEAGGRSGSYWRWLALLTVATLLLLAGFLIRREARQRVDEATASVERDVLSSHALGLQAARDGDDALFLTLLSAREPSWTEAQRALLGAGLLYDQSATPFGLQPAGEPEVADVSFSPDLQSAELQMTQRYTAAASSGSETVTLQRTVVYREGEQRWLLSPPESGFWGNRDSVTEGPLTVDYPMRDEDIARRLAADLTAMLTEMCGVIEELRCRPDWSMRLTLEKDPDSLLALSEAEAGAPTGPDVSLPTPSLVGVPADANDAANVNGAAYQALLRGYGRHLVAAAIGDLVGWECCRDGVLYYQALLHEQLAQLGLRPQPAPLSEYVYLVDEGASERALYEAAADYWQESQPATPRDEVPLAVHAFLAFMRDEGLAALAVDIQRSLAQTDAPSLLRWIDPSASSDGTLRDRVGSGFHTFARRQMQQASEEAELPDGLSLPQQDLLLACRPNDSDGFHLYRYELAAGTLSRETGVDHLYLQMAAGGPHGTVAVLATGGFAPQNVLWRPSGETLQVGGSSGSTSGKVWFPLAYGPGGELAALEYTLPIAESESTVRLLDVDTCDSEGCESRSLPGLPIWSPSAANMLALDVFQKEGLLYLRLEGDTTWKEVGRAWAPVWLDDEVYAYVPYSDQVRSGSLWAARVDDGEPQPLVPVDDLTAALPAALEGREVNVSWALPHPLDESQLLVSARSQSEDGQMLFIAEREAGVPWFEVPLAISFVEHFPEAVSFEGRISSWYGALNIVSPGGRWLLMSLGAPESGNPGLLLYDLVNQEIVLRSNAGTISGGLLGPTFSWSRDGEWLARPALDMIDVLAPGYKVDGRPYRRLIVRDFDACGQVVWVDGG